MIDPSASTIRRNDNLDELNIQLKAKEEIDALRAENTKLEFIIAKYNEILTQYQTKYGNELFLNVEKLVTNATDPNLPNLQVLNKTEMLALKKTLIENIALIKEYVARESKKSEAYDLLSNEAKTLREEKGKVQQENEELISKLEKIQKEKEELYSKVLQRGYQQNPEVGKEVPENSNFQGDNERENLLQQMEVLKSQAEYYQKAFSELSEKYDLLINDKEVVDQTLLQLREDNGNFQTKVAKLQNMVNEANETVLKLQKETETRKNEQDSLKSENNIYKKDYSRYKELYDEMEIRKNSEISLLQNTNLDLKNEVQILKDKNKVLSEQLSSQKFQNAQHKQEIATLKFDCAHFVKIFEDSSLTVQNAEEKEKHIDSTIRTYKKKIDEANLEKEKLEIQIKMKDNQISKMTNDFNMLLKEKLSQYGNSSDIARNKYEEIIKNKNDEINSVKTEILSLKMEKEKYFSEYSLLKNEYDKMSSNFHSENSAYIRQYEDAKRQMNKIVSEYEQKVSDLNIRCDRLDSDNKIYQQELKSYQNSEKIRQSQFMKMTMNENTLTQEMQKIKENLAFYTKENQAICKDRDTLIARYDTQIEHMKKEYEMKIIQLENTINYQKNKLETIEYKAFNMLKRQESLTEKFKEEYRNAIEYYENEITRLGGRGPDEEIVHETEEYIE